MTAPPQARTSKPAPEPALESASKSAGQHDPTAASQREKMTTFLTRSWSSTFSGLQELTKDVYKNTGGLRKALPYMACVEKHMTETNVVEFAGSLGPPV